MLSLLIPILSFCAPQEPDIQTLVAAAKCPLQKALALAGKEVAGGTPIAAELEEEDGHILWSFDIAKGKVIVEVQVDATDASILSKASEEEDRSALVEASKLSLRDAVAAVVGEHAGTPVRARLVLVDGAVRGEVVVFADGKTSTYRVDSAEQDQGKDKPRSRKQDEDGEETDDDEEDEHAESREDKGFTEQFGEEVKDLVSHGRNPWFVLEPGYTLVLEGTEKGEAKRIVIKVLDETRTIAGIEARVVEERETEGDELAEVTRDYYAISSRTNNVYYLGEDVDVYEDGKVTGHAGSWLHGEKGAHYGLMMPGVPLLGARFQQEVAPGVAMDRAEIASMTGRFECKAGDFEHVLKIVESTPLEKGSESKLYARGVGLLQDDGLKLVRYGFEKNR